MQPFRFGITLIVAIVGEVEMFVAVKLGTLPVPLAPNPIAVLELLQLNMALDVPENKEAATLPVLQTAMLVIGLTVGEGLTVIVNVTGLPMHVPIEGIALKIASMEVLVEFKAVNGKMFPMPEALAPIDGSLFVQLIVAIPAGTVTNVTKSLVKPAQTV